MPPLQFHAQTISESSKGALTWVTDACHDVARAVARSSGAQFLLPETLPEALDAPPQHRRHVDAVIVCSPTQFHREYVEMCLSRRKPVLCEKPLTSDTVLLASLFAKSSEAQTPLRVGYQRVFDRDIAQLVAEVQDHAAEGGQAPWSVSMRSYDSPTAPAAYLRQCGSAFMDAMCHDFHVAASLLRPGDAVVSATATEMPFADATLGARTATATFKTTQGTLVNAEFHRVSHVGYDNGIDVTFPSVLYRLASRPRFALTQGDGSGRLRSADYDTGFLTKYENAYRREIAAFLDEVSQEAALNARHAETCLSATWMVRMAIDAAEKGREVRLEDYPDAR